MTTLLWFRRDLRLADNPALNAAVAIGRPVIPVFICDDADAGEWSPGGATRWGLQGSLSALSFEIKARGNRLILKTHSTTAQREESLRIASILTYGLMPKPVTISQ